MQIGGTHLFWMSKRLTDLLLCVVLLPVLGCVTVVLSVANLWLNPGPLVFRQTRVGQHGNLFTIYKFRTMLSGPVEARFADAERHRISPFGHSLRRFRIDELPQVLNVIKGEMSLIGPRPEQPEFVHDYKLALPGYPLRHLVRPGLSGLSQVVQGYTSDTSGTRQKLIHDLRYIAESGFRMEGFVLWRTIVTVLTGFGAR